VPFRNAHFLSVAVSWAKQWARRPFTLERLTEDSSGYPDCRPEYYRAFKAGASRYTAGNKNRDYYSGHHNEEERDHPAAGRS